MGSENLLCRLCNAKPDAWEMLGFGMQDPQSSHRITTVYAEAQRVGVYSSLQLVEDL